MTTTLSLREIEVLQPINYEHNYREMASQLYISEHTVVSHRKNMMTKMEVKHTAGLIRRGFEFGILHLKRSNIFILCFFIMLIQSNTYAQEQCSVEIVQEVLTGEPYRSVSTAVALQTGLLYTQYDAATGTELWRSNGSAMSGSLVKDINPGVSSANPTWLYSLGSVVFFFAETSEYGLELWKSDGTVNGTIMVKDINPGVASSGYYRDSYRDSPFVGLHNGYLYFVANTENEGTELWRTDGSTEGTTIVKDFEPGTESSLSYGSNVNIVDLAEGTLIGIYDAYYISDGTTSGTYLLDDEVSLGVEHQDSFFYFSQATDTYPYDYYLSVTDGTLAGTEEIEFFDNRGYSFVLNDSLYFIADDSLRVYTGSDTRAILELGISQLYGIIGGNYIFASRTSSDHGTELWTTDGTETGTFMIKDINDGLSAGISTLYDAYIIHNGVMYFMGNDGIHGREFWSTDGTELGTNMIKDIVPGPNGIVISEFYEANNRIFFTANRGLYVSDGTSGGTVFIDQVDNMSISDIEDVTVIEEVIYFTAFVDGAGHQLIRTNGQQSGTGIVTASEILDGGYYFSYFSPSFKGYRYSLEDDDIWKVSKDTIIRIEANMPNAYASDWYAIDERLYFNSKVYSETSELYYIDENDNIVKLDFIDPLYASEMNGINDNIVLTGTNEAYDEDYLIWTDGTPAGTLTLNNHGEGLDNIKYPTPVGNKMFFRGRTSDHGEELWMTDGTIEGTTMVKDINIGEGDADPYNLTLTGGKLFFGAYDETHGRELWVSDGTPTGTVMVKDIALGSAWSAVNIVHAYDGVIYFIANDDINGEEIWRSDGTESGTHMIVDDYFFGDKYIYAPTYNAWKIGNDLYIAIDGDIESLIKIDLQTEIISEVMEGEYRDGFEMNGSLFLRYYENNEYVIGKYTPGVDSVLIPIDTAYTRNYSPRLHPDDSMPLIVIDDPLLGHQVNVVSCGIPNTCQDEETVTGIISDSLAVQAGSSILVSASVSAPSLLELRASQYIEFDYPFKILDDAQLRVDIRACPD